MDFNQYSFDPNSPKFIQDPYPFYEYLRREESIHRMQNGCWIFTRYTDISAALKNRQFSNTPHPFSTVSANNKERYPAARVAGNLMAFCDSPSHERLRKPFTNNFRTQLKNSKLTITNLAEELVLAAPRDNPFDFLKHIANPLAARSICNFLGYPYSSTKKLTEWSRQFFYLFHAIPNATVLEKVNQSILEFEAFTREIYNQKRRAPGNDLISLMITSNALTEDEVIHNIMLIAADGIGNVDVGMAVALRTLLLFPQELNRLRKNTELTKLAITECLRYDSPAQYQGRILLNQTEINGTSIPAMSIVLLALASANRDEYQDKTANDFIIDRKGFRNVSFGLGAHSCIGASLMQLQFEQLLYSLLKHSTQLSLTTHTVQWHARAGHRWPESLPIIIS